MLLHRCNEDCRRVLRPSLQSMLCCYELNLGRASQAASVNETRIELHALAVPGSLQDQLLGRRGRQRRNIARLAFKKAQRCVRIVHIIWCAPGHR